MTTTIKAKLWHCEVHHKRALEYAIELLQAGIGKAKEGLDAVKCASFQERIRINRWC